MKIIVLTSVMEIILEILNNAVIIQSVRFLNIKKVFFSKKTNVFPQETCSHVHIIYYYIIQISQIST